MSPPKMSAQVGKSELPKTPSCREWACKGLPAGVWQLCCILYLCCEIDAASRVGRQEELSTQRRAVKGSLNFQAFLHLSFTTKTEGWME